MEFKGTKGPWKMHPFGEAVIGDGKRVCITVPQGKSANEEDKHNAKLIAAAPELLDQAIKLRKWYEENREVYFGESTPIIFSELLSTIKKAIG